MGAAIVAETLGKRYVLGEGGHTYVTLRETLSRRLRRREPERADNAREIWALRDVDLEIEEGDVMGIVGRNGAGKTTLLKTVARIVVPTTGVVRVRGRVGALLEVGTGFHPELTGRENVYLNGVILGMTRREVRRCFDEIVEFAGVERFLDTPLKRYSSGMYLRLAFSVAAHIDPDVMIVDEVLAVGDAEFQRRCLERMSELGREGRTVLFVSHDTGAVGRLCRRAIWLDGGRVQDDGDAHEVIDRYLGTVVNRGERVEVPLSVNSPVRALSVALVDESGNPVDRLRRDERLRFDIKFGLTDPLPSFDLAIYLLTRDRTQVLSENISDKAIHIRGPGEFAVRLTIPGVLAAGDYVAGIWLASADGSLVYDEVLEFTLLPRADDRSEAIRRPRLVVPDVSWSIDSTT
jgi:ABC-2 type transport system ATP-binding protein/lipopolysaccharide transport system ATP-binding protein